ncbi:MAG: outer rane efflux protein [Acidobacteria bacterium]|nr:outer rane efflux protein [Acidobacteriota bacterium]
MRRACFVAALTVAALCGAPAPGFGEAQAEGGLTLDQAVERALAASHRLAEFEARRAGAEAAAAGRKAADRPLASVQAGYTRTNHVDEFGIPPSFGRPATIIYPDVPDNFRTRLDLQWPIYSFGRTGALERAARAEVDAAGFDLDAARNDLTLEVTRAFWAVITAQEAVRVLDESLKRMDAALADVRNRLNVGLVPPSDVLSAEAQRSRELLLLVQARNRLDQARADLRLLTDLPLEAPVQPIAAFEAPPAPVRTLTELIAEAEATRPERRALAARVAGAGQRREAARANRLPTLAVAGGVDYARPNPRVFPRTAEWNESWDAGVQFNWTFWDAGRTGAAIGEAGAAERAAEQRLREFDRALALEVTQRQLDLSSAAAAIAAASDSVRSAAEARRVLGERFAAGVATSTEALDAHVTLLQAELLRTEAIANARLAEARLARALGR